MSKKIEKIIKKKIKKKIVCLTAYSKNIAKVLDKYCDITLVGDSLANVLYGMENTHKVSLDLMIQHSVSVKRELNTLYLLLICLKARTRHLSKQKKNAILIKKKTGCDAVKIESNKKNFKVIKEIKKVGIPVMGHIGFTPQFKKNSKLKVEIKRKLKI